MSQSELLMIVVDTLDKHGIEYMLTGSVASSLQGEPRFSHDIDFVVLLTPAKIPQLLASFSPSEFYLSEAGIHDALSHRTMFNLLHPTSGNKADFWVLKDTPYDHARWSRRQAWLYHGTNILVPSPEDTILSKLLWSKEYGGSLKQIQDARRVYEVQYSILDAKYIERWVNDLDLQQSWQELVTSSIPIE